MNRQDVIKALRALVEALESDGDAATPCVGNDQAYYDDGNPEHQAEAQRLFDRYELVLSRRQWFRNKGLQGVRMRDLADVVDQEVRTFERMYPRYARRQAANSQRRH